MWSVKHGYGFPTAAAPNARTRPPVCWSEDHYDGYSGVLRAGSGRSEHLIRPGKPHAHSFPLLFNAHDFGRSHPYDELQVQSKSAHHAGFIVPDAHLSSERTYSVCIDGWNMAKKTLLYAGSVKR
jgi:hypothetical protein